MKPNPLLAALTIAVAVSISAFPLNAGESEYSSSKDYKGDIGPIRSQPFPFKFSADILQGYDNNINTTPVNEEESLFTNVRIGTVGSFGNARTNVNVNLGAGLTYFYDRETGDDVDYTVSAGLGLTHRLTPRLILSLTTTQQIQSEPDFALVGAASRRTDSEYLYGASRIDVAYQWTSRFQTVTSYTLTNLFYFENDNRRAEDRLQHFLGQQFRYLWTPTTTLVAEYRFGYVDVLDAERDSYSNYILAGADFVFSPRLSGGFRGGVEIREFDEGSSNTSPFAEGNLAYAYGPYGSRLQAVVRYGQEQPADVFSQSRETFRIGLTLNHGFTPRLSAQLEAYYQNNDTSGRGGLQDAFTEDIYDFVAGLRFALTQDISLRGGYSYTVIESTDDFREYDRSRIYAGVGITF